MVVVARRVRDHRAVADDDLITAAEAATILRVSPRTMRIWAKRGLIRSFTVGPGKRGTLRFVRYDVKEYIARKVQDSRS